MLSLPDMRALLLSLLTAAPAATTAPSILPLTRVVLYENGLGYFERSGTVKPAQTLTIPLEANQLDDALKSLVVMSPKLVESVNFEPPVAASAAQQLVGVSDENPPSTVAALVQTLKGTEVSVQGADGRERTGRVFDVVEEERHLGKDGTVNEPVLVLAGQAGLQRLWVKDLVSIRPLDAHVRTAWDRATLARSKFGTRDSVTVQGPREGGPIAIGYTTEAPVWKVTYRLVLDAKRSRLQGLALVHNDSDDPWQNVNITLASGKPNSFVTPMAGPRYAHRELVNVDDGLDAAPQLSSEEVREHLRGPAVMASMGYGTRGSGSGGGGYGSAMGLGSVGTRGHGAGVASGQPGVTTETLSSAPATAVSEAGDLWLYKVLTPVSIGARRSAMVPFLDTTVKGERVTVVTRDNEVFSAVSLANDTDNTFEAGTMSLFIDGVFDGETTIDRLKPREVRVIRHGTDIDVSAARVTEFTSIDATDLKVVMVDTPRLEVKERQRLTQNVTMTSHSPRPRTLLLELNGEGYNLMSGATEDPRSPGQPRYGRVSLAPRQSATFAVVEETLQKRRYAANELTVEQVRRLQALADAPGKATLQPILTAVERAAHARELQATLDTRLKDVDAQLTRVKDLLTAAKTTKGATELLGQQLVELEARRKPLLTERENLNEATQSVALALKGLLPRAVSQR